MIAPLATSDCWDNVVEIDGIDAFAKCNDEGVMGFIGHTAGGDFHPSWAVPIACAGVAGGLIGAKSALKAKPRNLKQLFAWTTLAAAVFMMANAGLSE